MTGTISYRMGQKIKRLRETNGVSIEDCARFAGRSPHTWRDWELKGLPWKRTGRAFMAVKSATHEQGGYQLHMGF